MAVPIEDSRRKGCYLGDQAWRNMQTMLPVPEPHLPMPTTIDASYEAGWPTSSQAQCWPEASTSIGDASIWNGLSSGPFIMSSPETQYLQNGNLNYGHIAAVHFPFETKHFADDGGHIWQPTEMNGLPNYGYFFEGSDTVASSSSPRSLFSELSEHNSSFETDAVVGCPSPILSWRGNEAQSFTMFRPILKYEESSSAATQSSLRVSDLNLPGSQREDFAGSFTHPHDIVDRIEMPYHLRSITSYPLEGSTSSPSQSYAPSSTMPSALPYPVQTQEQHGNSLPYGTNNAFVTYPTPPHRLDEQVYSTSTIGITPDAQIPLIVGAEAQRAEEDKILLEGKQNGLTYKEIRKKMRTRVAESTLRGRYRSLTKERKDRVRRPIWTAKDIRLLEEIVFAEFRSIDNSNYRTSTYSQKLAKVSWKRVAEYIALGGGSYHFGNSTCKKKWSEIDVGR